MWHHADAVFYGSGPSSPLMGDMGFTAPLTASQKNLLYENLARSVLIPAPKKQSRMFSKAAELPSISVTHT